MNFARTISPKIIYMDEKGIYEMGSPSQIFDAPQREKTRAFINRLKTFHRTITDRNFDIYELNSAAVEFCRRQYASEKQIYRVQLVLEEMLLNIILPQLEDGKIAVDVTVEYSVKDSPPRRVHLLGRALHPARERGGRPLHVHAPRGVHGHCRGAKRRQAVSVICAKFNTKQKRAPSVQMEGALSLLTHQKCRIFSFSVRNGD